MSFALRIAIVFLLIFLTEFYFIKKIINSVRIIFPHFSSKKISITRWIALIIIHIYPAALLFAWLQSAISKQASIAMPDNTFFDYAAVYPFWISVLIIVQSILFFLLIDIIRLLLFPLYKRKREKLKPFIAKLILGISFFFILYVPLRIIYDYNSVSIRIKEYKAKNLPKDLRNFKITFIADVQADRYTDTKRLNKFISKVNDTHPDLVLIGGDVITSTPDYIQTAAEYIGKIKSVHGVYSCVGDHDNWAYREDTKRSVREITEALNKYNVEMINDGRRVIKVGNAEIGITFVTNTYVETIPDAELDHLTNEKTNYNLNIFLVHQPRQRLVDQALKQNYDLFLAGHTHGGQITFLFPFYNLSPTLFETKYVRGDFEFGKMLMIVTRGLGMSLVPLRYNSTPEVTVIVLESS
ncbi:MAG TPA: metallophosphoesterase [Ignavibacteriaceae bacterium]|nr:metallophosphoesterase [Ignavibacteriaceae bacterium]